jgi:hypothetical protein
MARRPMKAVIAHDRRLTADFRGLLPRFDLAAVSSSRLITTRLVRSNPYGSPCPSRCPVQSLERGNQELTPIRRSRISSAANHVIRRSRLIEGSTPVPRRRRGVGSRMEARRIWEFGPGRKPKKHTFGTRYLEPCPHLTGYVRTSRVRRRSPRKSSLSWKRSSFRGLFPQVSSFNAGDVATYAAFVASGCQREDGYGMCL